LRCYEECARIKPYSEEPWMHIEMTYRRMGNDKASDQAKRKLIDVGARKVAVNPNDAITLSRMAGALAHFGEKEKAYAALKKIMEVDPTDGLTQYNSACTYAALGDKKEALACLSHAIQNGYKNVGNWVKIDPDFVSYHEDPEFKALLAEIG
jgi:adenylate cyclase